MYVWAGKWSGHQNDYTKKYTREIKQNESFTVLLNNKIVYLNSIFIQPKTDDYENRS